MAGRLLENVAETGSILVRTNVGRVCPVLAYPLSMAAPQEKRRVIRYREVGPHKAVLGPSAASSLGVVGRQASARCCDIAGYVAPALPCFSGRARNRRSQHQ